MAASPLRPATEFIPQPGRTVQTEVRSRNTEIAVAVFRTIFLLIVLFSPQFMQARGARGALLVAAVIAAASYNLAVFVLHMRGLPFPRVIISLADATLVTLWVYFCGEGGERFVVLYYAVVIVAGLWLGVSGALIIAVFASAQYVLALMVAPLPLGVPGTPRIPRPAVWAGRSSCCSCCTAR